MIRQSQGQKSQGEPSQLKHKLRRPAGLMDRAPQLPSLSKDVEMNRKQSNYSCRLLGGG